jgi:hypothetical protein
VGATEEQAKMMISTVGFVFQENVNDTALKTGTEHYCSNDQLYRLVGSVVYFVVLSVSHAV